MKKLLLSLSLLALASIAAEAASEEGADLIAPFARAHAGQPLRVVALGGSITQGGGGWIGDWLKLSFPSSCVSMCNAGMSAMGSEHAIFRLERDVIANQPDIVLFEFAVNDGGPSERVIWSVESVVRRLKSLPNPPAIVMLEAANRRRAEGVVPPQRDVAKHYGLFSVDLQAALKKHLAEKGLKWEDLLGDDVHPNANGNAFYTEAISKALQPFAEKARGASTAIPQTPLPPVLSKRELILDGKLMAVPASGKWKKEHSTPGWWDMFFLGDTACKEGGEVLSLSFRGTIAGLFYAMDERYGMLYASVDGAPCKAIVTNSRKGYSYTIVAEDLSPGGHILNLSIPKDAAGEEGVKLGYVMVGGPQGESGDLAPQGTWTPEKIAQLKEGVVPSGAWAWIGPFGDTSSRWPADDKELPNLNSVFWPERDMGPAPNLKPQANDPYAKLAWKPCGGNSAMLDFGRLTGHSDRGVAYAWTVVENKEPQKLRCLIIIDYYCKIWLNGKLVHEVAQHHGGPVTPIEFELPLETGRNNLLIKAHSGSMGFLCGFRAPEAKSQPDFQAPSL